MPVGPHSAPRRRDVFARTLRMQKRLVLTIIVPAALTACGGHPAVGARAVAQAAPVAAASPTPVTTSPTHVTASPAQVTSSPAPVTPPPTVLTAKLTPESGSKVAGTATVTTAGATFTIRLEATGLQPATTHPAHIRAGTCGSNGPIVFPLENMVTNGAGHAVAATWIHHPYQVPASGWFVEILQGPTSSGSGAKPIACAKLPAH